MARDSRWGSAKWGATSAQTGAGEEMPWGSGAADGDVVNVGEVANKVGVGPVLSPAFARNDSGLRSSNRYRP